MGVAENHCAIILSFLFNCTQANEHWPERELLLSSRHHLYSREQCPAAQLSRDIKILITCMFVWERSVYSTCAEDDILCTSARYLYTMLHDVMSLVCWTVIYGANFQSCSNGMTTGNNDIADTTACSVTYLRQWLPCV